jgi:hypothetical protein
MFFIKIHPIIIFDTDDWYYSFANRGAYPISSAWNPTRVLPETIMPFVLLFGTNILSIFSDNYINNVIVINSIVVSSFILLYVYSFYNLLKEKFKLNILYNFSITILFILLHFLIFRNANANNLYMFYSLDACCYYYYLIPGLLNMSLVMNYVTYKKFYFKDNIFRTSIMFLLCYLSIFSNLFHSIILASFIGTGLLIELIDKKILSKSNFKFDKIKEFLINNIDKFIILFAWLLVQLFELKGGRASSLNSNLGFIVMFKNSIKDLIGVYGLLNKTFIKISLFTLTAGIFIIFKKRLYKDKIFINSICSMLITVLYLLLVCSKAGSWYISRPDVLISILTYIFVFICFVLSYILKKYKRLFIIVPTLLFILYFEINTSDTTFRESNILNLPYEDCIKINNEIINQIKEASYNDLNIIYIPKFDSNDNWPIAFYGHQWIIESLNKHGVIKNKFIGNFEISKSYYGKVMGGENYEK